MLPHMHSAVICGFLFVISTHIIVYDTNERWCSVEYVYDTDAAAAARVVDDDDYVVGHIDICIHSHALHAHTRIMLTLYDMNHMSVYYEWTLMRRTLPHVCATSVCLHNNTSCATTSNAHARVHVDIDIDIESWYCEFVRSYVWHWTWICDTTLCVLFVCVCCVCVMLMMCGRVRYVVAFVWVFACFGMFGLSHWYSIW